MYILFISLNTSTSVLIVIVNKSYHIYMYSPEKEIAKHFVSGLKHNIFREEMYSRTFENLDYVIREARKELSTYRDKMIF